MEKYVVEFDTANDDQKNELANKITTELDERLNEYKHLFDPEELNYLPTKKKIFTKIINFLRTNKFVSDLINVGLKKREKERIEEKCPDQTYKPPKRHYDIRDLKEHPEKIDELVDNMSDSDESGNE